MTIRRWLSLITVLAAAGATNVVLPSSYAAVKAPATTSTTIDPFAVPVGSDTVVNSWALSPAGPANARNQPSERAYLSYSAAPGQTINDAVVLHNYSNVPLRFQLYPTDAFNDPDGGFGLLSGDRKPKDVGTWIEMAQKSVSMPPKSQAIVPIIVRIPRTATPGDHTGAVLASSETKGVTRDGKAVDVDRRTGSRVYIRVAGPIEAELAITKVTNTYRPSWNPFAGRSDVTYRLQNVGNVRLKGKHRVSVAGLLGLGKKSTAYVKLREDLLPGEEITVSASFKGLPATILSFATAKVDADDTGGKTLKPTSQGAATLAVPWTIVALALIAGFARYARRAYRRHASDVADAPGESEPQTV